MCVASSGKISGQRHLEPTGPNRNPLAILAIRYVILGTHFYAESELRQLIALAKRGNRVTAIVARTSSPLPSLPHEPGFVLRTVLVRRSVPPLSLFLFELVAAWNVIKSFRSLDCLIFDVSSTALLFPALFLLHLINRHRRPALFLRVQTNPVETEGHLRTFLDSLFYTSSIKFASSLFDRILFITPMLAAIYRDPFNIPITKIAIWPSSVDLGCFCPRSTQEILQLRRHMNLSDQLVVLYHGSLTRARGIPETVEAFSILRKKGVRATLVLLGYGPLRHQLVEYVRIHELQDTIRVPDPAASIAEVADYIAASDVEIAPMPNHPWWRYQCFIKVLETLSMNKPLIASDIPAIRYLIGDAPVVLYLKGTSPLAIANGVSEFLETKQNLDPQLGRQIASQYSVEEVARMLEEQVLSAVKPLNSKEDQQIG